MSTTLAQFKRRLEGDAIPPVVLLAGAEHLLVQEAADAMRARARALGYSEREVIDADARFDWARLRQAGASMSLFSTRRLIDLRLPTGRPGKEGSAAIIEWCKSPPADTALLITCNEWSKKHDGAWVKAVDKAGVSVAIWPLKLNEWPAWIDARMRTHGLQPTPDAVAALVDRTEGNLLAAAQEIEKLSVLNGPGPINAETLGELVADSARFDVFKLTDAALLGDAPRALRILAGLRAEGEEVVPMMGWLAKQIEVALRLASARDFNEQARTEYLWADRQQVFRKALRRGTRGHWQACLHRAARIDRISKGREFGDAWREVERLVLAMASPASAQALC